MSTGCPKKNYPLFWSAVTPIIIVGNAKSRTLPRRAQVDASVAYSNFSGAQKAPEIFEFKVDCLQK